MSDEATPGASNDDGTAGSGEVDTPADDTTGGGGQDSGRGDGGSDGGSDGGKDVSKDKAGDRQPATRAGKTEAASEEFNQLPDWAQKRIRGLEKEAGDNRHKAKNAEGKAALTAKEHAERLQGFIDGFAKVMGLTVDEDTKPQSLDEAMRRLEDSDAQIKAVGDQHRQALVKLAVWEQAATHGANTPELMDSAAFLSKITGLDPSAEDFTSSLGEIISAQVEANPTRFKAQPPQAAVPPKSGGEFTGGPGGRPNDAMSIQEHLRHIDPVARQRT